jgi:HEAT repeat protein
MLLQTTTTRRLQEVIVPKNRDKPLVVRIFFRCFVLCVAIILFSGGEVGAQAEVPLDGEGVAFETSDFEQSLDETARAAIGKARRQLEQALADSDSNTRFDALREAMALHEPWIANIVLPLCESPDVTVKNLALEAVAASNPEQGREAFLMALEHPQRSVRLRGLLGLEKLGDAGTVVEVIKILEEDQDPDLQVVAARTLGAIGDISASTALRQAIESRRAPLREQAVLALLAIGKEDVGRYLIRSLDNDNRSSTTDILKLLALVPDPSLIALIRPYLDSQGYTVRSHASVAILSILERSRSGQP